MSLQLVAERATAVTSSPELRQMLMQCTGALSRRRAYAATHPMVLAAEQQLYESITGILQTRRQLVIGVAKADLLVDGEPYVSKSSYARDLATRLHRRGVGAMTFTAGMTLLQLREALAWLASEPDGEHEQPPRLAGVSVAQVAYDQLALGTSAQIASASIDKLWQSLAQLAGEAGHPGAATGDEQQAAFVKEEMLESLRGAMQQNSDVALRTAIALQDIAVQASSVSGEVRRTMAQQLNDAIVRLGTSSFGPIIRSLGERSLQHSFVSQVVSVLPAAAVADWLKVAAQSREQQMSHHLLRLMSKLSGYADTHRTQTADTVLRSAAQDLVSNWMLDDPNPEEHVALLDRIAMHERVQTQSFDSSVDAHASDVESARLVQMALEIGVMGADAVAAAEALVCNGHFAQLMQWVRAAGHTPSATRLRSVIVSDTSVRTLLLSEPVDRLQARALLEQLDASAADLLIDVLASSEARGTRLLVRQRLAEFGSAILPTLLARLDAAPWFLVRNILTLLHEIALESNGAGAALENMVALLEHPQVQVRIEAFRLLLLDPRAREAALRRALHDEHERLVILALQALTEQGDAAPLLSHQVVTQLIMMVDAGAHSEPLRARMVRALAFTHDDRVREWLIAHATRRSRVLRRLQLADATPVAVAAVYALKRSYHGNADVQKVLGMVKDSGVERQWKSREPAVAQEALA